MVGPEVTGKTDRVFVWERVVVFFEVFVIPVGEDDFRNGVFSPEKANFKYFSRRPREEEFFVPDVEVDAREVLDVLAGGVN